MATSGTTTFNLDVAEFIEEAFERCGLMTARTAQDLKSAKRSIDLMLAEWTNRGLNLWTVAEGSYTTTAGTANETLIEGMSDILEVVLRRDGTDYELSRISREDYFYYPNKTSTGRPSEFWLDRQIVPVLYLWPTPENSTDTLVYKYARRIEDAGAFQNTLDVPWRFYPALVAGLAYYLSMKIAPQRTAELKMVYNEELKNADDEDIERASLFILPQAARR